MDYLIRIVRIGLLLTALTSFGDAQAQPKTAPLHQDQRAQSAQLPSQVSPPAPQHQTNEPASQESTSKGKEVPPPQGNENALAAYTLWLAIFTGVLAASTIGLWLVTWQTLRHAKRDAERQSSQMKASIDAANASASWAEQSVAEVRRVGEAQVRAYPAFIPLELNTGTDGHVGPSGAPAFGSRIGFDVKGVIRNSGQSPARNVAIEFVVFEVPVAGPHAPVASLTLRAFPAAGGEIGANGERPQGVGETINVNLASILAGITTVRIAGKVVYRDVFGLEQASWFDGIILNLGPYISHVNTTGTAVGVPALQWRWI